MVLYGINSVCERLRCNPASIEKIFLENSFKNKQIETLISKHKVSNQRVTAKGLQKIKAKKGLQKIVAKVKDFRYTSLADVLERPAGKNCTLLFLDNINDPQNVGVILRTVACLGGFALVLPKQYTCGVNDTVMHVASGGENYVPVAQVESLAKAITAARQRGYVVGGAMLSADAENIDNVNFTFPLGMVFGSESDGIGKRIRNILDFRVQIPMEGAALSLNVNNACAIFCYQVLKQRRRLNNEEEEEKK